MSHIKTSKVLHRFGTWAVTTYGVESLVDQPYSIKFDALLGKMQPDYTWFDHLNEKNWMAGREDDFRQAMIAAWEVFKSLHPRRYERALVDAGLTEADLEQYK